MRRYESKASLCIEKTADRYFPIDREMERVLRKYGADLSSLAQKPEFLGGTRGTGIDLEARLYPGVALVLLGGGGVLWFTGSAVAAGGWRRRAVAARCWPWLR